MQFYQPRSITRRLDDDGKCCGRLPRPFGPGGLFCLSCDALYDSVGRQRENGHWKEQDGCLYHVRTVQFAAFDMLAALKAIMPDDHISARIDNVMACRTAIARAEGKA